MGKSSIIVKCLKNMHKMQDMTSQILSVGLTYGTLIDLKIKYK